MPPSLALFGCFAFAFWVFWRDAKQHPYPSVALWLPSLWMMRCGSRGIDSWMGGDEYSGNWDQVLVAVLSLLGFLVLLFRPCRWREIITHNGFLFLFYGYLCLSFFWVESLDNPYIKIFRPLGDLIMALIVATETNPREAITTLFRRCAILLIPLSIVLAKYFPDLGRGMDKHWGDDPWIGVTTQKNPLGQLCIVSALGYLWLLVQARAQGKRVLRQGLPWLYLAMTVYLFNGDGVNRSTTSIACLVLAMALFILVGRLRNQADRIGRWITGGATALVFLELILQLSGTTLPTVVAEAQGKDETLTGRVWLWKDVVRLGMKSPIFGTGYGGFWVPSIYDELSPEVDNKPAQAHSGYLETFANLGFVGVALLAALILQSLLSAAKLVGLDFEYGRIRLVLLFMVMVLNYAEASFPRGTHLWWFGFLVMALYAQPWVFWPQHQEAASAAYQEMAREEEEEVPA